MTGDIAFRWKIRKVPDGWIATIHVLTTQGVPYGLKTHGYAPYQALGDTAEALDATTDLIPVVSEAKATLQLINALAKLMEDESLREKIKGKIRKVASVWSKLRKAFLWGEGPEPFGGFHILGGIHAPIEPEKVDGFMKLIGALCV